MHSKTTRILIISGLDNEREYYQDLLINVLSQDYDIHDAQTLKQATEVLTTTEVDCLLIDYGLYEMAGREALSLLTRSANGTVIPCVVMVPESAVATAGASLSNGAVATLKTEMTAEKLQNLISTAVNSQESQERTQPFYFSDMLGEAEKKQLRVVGDLEKAMSNHELYLRYQPIFDLHSHDIVAHEALLRWNHPTMDIIGPKEFIPLAERAGLMGSIGRWIFGTACSDMVQWRKTTIMPQSVFVKLTDRQIQDEGLSSWLKNMVDQHRIDPGHIYLEVSESQIVPHLASCVKSLDHFVNEGFKICIQNVGSYTQDIYYSDAFPQAMLKLSPVLTREMMHCAQTRKKVKQLIHIGVKQNHHVVATGVEQEDQLRMLKELGCAMAQGYYLCLPLKARGVAHLLEDIMRVSNKPQMGRMSGAS